MINDLPSRLALLRTNLQPEKLHLLLNHFGSADNILAANNSQLEEFRLSPTALERLRSPDDNAIKRDISWASKDNHYIICLDDTNYPERLKSIPNPPYLLFVAGDIDYLQQPQLAMVGSRTPTAVGKQTAFDFARHLSTSGLTITSGLALGIDTACHKGALEGIAGTIAVVANGLDQVYPKSNTKLAQHIVRQGCVVSESPLGTAPHKGLFPRRNRVISGLSIGTLVVEAAKNSGSLITTRHALEQNREVFAIPGSIHNPLSRGCHSLIRQGAKLVETAQDIIEELLPLEKLASTSHTSDQSEDIQAEISLDPAYQALLNSMEFEPANIDELVERNQMGAAEIASMLLILELQGHVVSENGVYSRIHSEQNH
jgi:DNA processing protein